MKTEEEWADSIAKWNNQGMRQAVVDLLKERKKSLKDEIVGMIDKEIKNKDIEYAELLAKDPEAICEYLNGGTDSLSELKADIEKL